MQGSQSSIPCGSESTYVSFIKSSRSVSTPISHRSAALICTLPVKPLYFFSSSVAFFKRLSPVESVPSTTRTRWHRPYFLMDSPLYASREMGFVVCQKSHPLVYQPYAFTEFTMSPALM